MNTIIIYISDIHFTGRTAENEDVVINAFLRDAKKQLEEIPHKDVFVFIGGDLVQKADDKESYDNFWNDVIVPLIALGIKREHIICVPGNHDIQRTSIEENKIVYSSIVSQDFTECKFNDLLESEAQVNLLTKKFENYENFLKEKATASILCKKAGADIFPVDIGIAADSTIIQHKVMYGTKNMAKEPAMTREQAVQALEVGIHMVEELKEKGYGIVATGEMGIGNTTTSSAVTAVLLEQDPAKVTGRGAGLSSAGLEKKISVIRDAIALHKPKKEDPIDVLAKVGGLDIAGMAGVFLGGAACQIPVVADGFISCVAALCAIRICPTVKDYVITSHKSKEPATVMILEALDIPVFLDCDMCLGEGTGAVTIYPILDMALAVYGSMSTFADIQMDNYVPLV